MGFASRRHTRREKAACAHESAAAKWPTQTQGATEARRAGQEQTQLNRAICAAADNRNPEALLDLVQAKQSRMNFVNFSTAFHRLARLTVEENIPCWNKDDPRAQSLLRGIKAQLLRLSYAPGGDPHPRCLSTIAWACGRLQDYDPEAMDIINDLSARWIHLFKPFELANLLWGFAKLQIGSPLLFRAAQDQIALDIGNYTTRSISLIAWAFATARPMPCARLLRKAAEAFACSLDSADEKPVSIANLVWALATMGVHPRNEVLREIGDAAALSLSNFKANELSITLWAFARLCCWHEPLFVAAAARLHAEKGLRNDIHSQGIANILWAFARQCNVAMAGHTAMRMASVLPSLLPTCLRLLPQLSPMEFSSVVSAVSKLALHFGLHGAAEHVLLSAAAGAGADQAFVGRFSNQAVANVLSTYESFYEGSMVIPDACCRLMGRLEQLRADRGLELERSSVLAAMWESDAQQAITENEAAAFDAQERLLEALTGQLSSPSASGSPPGAGTATAPARGRGVQAPSAPPSPAATTAFKGAAPPAASFSPAAAAAAALPAEPAYICPGLLAGEFTPGTGVAARGPIQERIYSLDEPAFVDVPRSSSFGFLVPVQTQDTHPEPAVLSVVPEFSYVDDGDEKEAPRIVLAFEVEALGSATMLDILVEVFAEGKAAREHARFPIEVEGMYKVSLPPEEGNWELRISARSPSGDLAAEVLALPFAGCNSRGPSILEYGDSNTGRRGPQPAPLLNDFASTYAASSCSGWRYGCVGGEGTSDSSRSSAGSDRGPRSPVGGLA